MTEEILQKYKSDTSLKNLRSEIYKTCKILSKANQDGEKVERIFSKILFFYNILVFIFFSLNLYFCFVPIYAVLFPFALNILFHSLTHYLHFSRRKWKRTQMLSNLDEIAVQISIQLEKGAEARKNKNPNLDKMIIFYLNRFGKISDHEHQE